MHAVRVVVVPPSVKLPVGHAAHALAPTEAAKRLSCPHGEHLCCPDELNLPASHFTCALVPEHLDPAVHAAHVWRVVELPPLVNEPTGHVPQMLAPASAYKLSFPQSPQSEDPADANFPGAQADTEPDPSPHAAPVGHTVHLVRVMVVPPSVK